MSVLRTRRLMGELRKMKADPPQQVRLLNHEDMGKWTLSVEGAAETLYAGEHFQLQFTFPVAYPLEAAEVVFVGDVPVHPHVYSNGHICLSILYQHWSPVLTVEAVRPAEDQSYVKRATKSPKDASWRFDDDGV
ncbi:hypothetical protein GGI20_002756 [Coemansia sp. BCRC 34301]|nr:hypothetical protein GGI20_002756 [Coemansia sp. BCRC 34301]